jgi:hypothetical protein
MSFAVGEAHGNGVSNVLLTPKGLNVFGAGLMAKIFDPFGVGNFISLEDLSRGFHPREWCIQRIANPRGVECVWRRVNGKNIRPLRGREFYFFGGILSVGFTHG